MAIETGDRVIVTDVNGRIGAQPLYATVEALAPGERGGWALVRPDRASDTYRVHISRLLPQDEACAPDCEERTACEETGAGHSMCGRRADGTSRHHWPLRSATGSPTPEIEEATMANTTYTRGTRTERVKTARLVPGQQVLTEPGVEWATNPDGSLQYNEDRSRVLTRPRGEDRVQAAQTKTGATIRTIERLVPVAPARHGYRAQRTYTVHFTDGTRAEGNAPVYTWHAISRGPAVLRDDA